jgi:hypothetical protein
MPEATLAQLNLEGLTPGELEQRRRDIVASLTRDYKGYDDPAVPTSLLHELVAITSSLRKRTSGPPRAAKTAAQRRNAAKPRATTDDLAL